MEIMSVALHLPAEPAASSAAPVRPPGTVRGPLILAFVMAVIATAIALFVVATEKHPVPVRPAVVVGTTIGIGDLPAAQKTP